MDTSVTEHPATESPASSGPTHAPLPASERDLRWRSLKSRGPGFRIALISGAILALVAVFFLWRYFSSYESTDDAQIDGHLISISARVSGHVVKRLVDDNQVVQAGTPLVQIDPSDYQIALDRAKAAYQDALATAQAAEVNVPITSVGTSSQITSAEGDVQNATAGISWAKQQLDASRAQVDEAEANNTKAQNDLARYKQLVDKQEISQQQYDQAIAAAKSGAATLLAARAAAAAAEQTVRQWQSKLAQAQANLKSAQTGPQQLAITRARAQAAQAQVGIKKAEMDQAQLNLQYTTITAPVSGIVSNRTVEVGQNVQIGQEMMKVVDLDNIWITANYKETQLQHMRPGQPVEISVDAFDKTYKGHVQSIAGASGALFSLLPPENATGNYVKVVQRIPVKITFDPGETREHILRPGMSVEAKVEVK
jgi:membrane fusion protein (multidrug efflux system)